MADSNAFLFVSHVSEDQAAALEIVGELERRGVPCWIAPRNVNPGGRFDDEIADALDNCRAMLLIFSAHCNESEYIRREVTVAGETHKTIIPFRIDDAEPRRGLRVRLSDLHWLDGFASRERAIDQLVQTFAPSLSEREQRQRPEEERQQQEEEQDHEQREEEQRAGTATTSIPSFRSPWPAGEDALTLNAETADRQPKRSAYNPIPPNQNRRPTQISRIIFQVATFLGIGILAFLGMRYWLIGQQIVTSPPEPLPTPVPSVLSNTPVMPNVIGVPAVDASQMLRLLGFQHIREVHKFSRQPNGTVIEQVPDAGVRLLLDRRITLMVAAIPPPHPSPSPSQPPIPSNCPFGTAAKSWCEGTRHTWASNPGFFPQLPDLLEEQHCGSCYGITAP